MQPQAVQSILVALQRDHTAAELSQRLQDEVVRPRSDVLLEEPLRFQSCIAALLGVHLRPTVVVVVDEGVLQVARFAVQDDHLVHGTGGVVARPFPLQQPQLVVGVVAAIAHQFPHDVVVPRHPPSGLVLLCDDLTYFCCQFRRGSLVGIHEEDPIGLYLAQRRVPLGGEVVEGALYDLCTSVLCDLHRAIVAVAVGKDDAIAPAQTGDAVGDVRGLVLGQNDGSEHGSSVGGLVDW